MSDVDLVVVARDGGMAAIFQAAEAALSGLCPIALRYHVPDPTWHGHAQRLYRLRDTSPFHMVDLVVQKEHSTNRFLEPERHGHARLLFGKAGYADVPPSDMPARDVRLQARIPVLADWFELGQPLVEKELLRERPLDALNFYQGLTLRPLVELLRIVHNPWRHDFGMRYLQQDLPADVYARLEPLAFVAGIDDLKTKHRQAVDWFREVRASL